MPHATHVKPISDLKTNAAEVLARLAEDGKPLLISQNGEAKAVLQDVADYERQQETLAMLKILALGTAQVEAGRSRPLRAVIEEMRGELKTEA